MTERQYTDYSANRACPICGMVYARECSAPENVDVTRCICGAELVEEDTPLMQKLSEMQRRWANERSSRLRVVNELDALKRMVMR